VEWLARLILLGMVGLSVWSVSIIIDRRRFFKKYAVRGASEQLFQWIEKGQKAELLQWAQQNEGWQAKLLLTLLTALNNQGQEPSGLFLDRIERLLVSLWLRERSAFESGLAVLGTLGSTTPFVGLLGTILGIIVSFGALSTGQIDSQKIMFALAEALVLTAVGLGVAIPAVVAYNYFSKRLMEFQREADALKDGVLSRFMGRP
jgi:biopolymer transport protein ExbB/TolQ